MNIRTLLFAILTGSILSTSTKSEAQTNTLIPVEVALLRPFVDQFADTAMRTINVAQPGSVLQITKSGQFGRRMWSIDVPDIDITVNMVTSSIDDSLIMTYPVEGQSVDELVSSMQNSFNVVAAGLGLDNDNFWAYTSYSKPNVGFILEPPAAPTQYKYVTFEMNVLILLPRWEGYEAADECLKSSWDKMISALRYHEGQHAALALALEDKIRKTAFNLPRYESSVLRKTVESHLVNSLYNEMHQIQQIFDLYSVHGFQDPDLSLLFEVDC